MAESKVYFSDMRAHGQSLLLKLKRLMKAAGFENIDFAGKFVAVKIHFGEPGNLAYLRPNWAGVVCDYVKELGGKPFLTDCNTLYVGGRKTRSTTSTAPIKTAITPSRRAYTPSSQTVSRERTRRSSPLRAACM